MEAHPASLSASPNSQAPQASAARASTPPQTCPGRKRLASATSEPDAACCITHDSTQRQTATQPWHLDLALIGACALQPQRHRRTRSLGQLKRDRDSEHVARFHASSHQEASVRRPTVTAGFCATSICGGMNHAAYPWWVGIFGSDGIDSESDCAHDS